MSQLFSSGGQSIGTSASVLPIDLRGFLFQFIPVVSFISSCYYGSSVLASQPLFGKLKVLKSNSMTRFGLQVLDFFLRLK